VTSFGLPDVVNNHFFGKLFDTETGFTVLDHVHYDPDVLKFDTDVECQLDYVDLLDPARYNVGPGAAFSNETCWGFNQVNELWWSTERRTFVDYRSLIPNYEDAAAQWGRLEFFKANITRVDDIVTVETLDPFGSGAVVPHGIAVSDVITVSFRGAAETEYNLQQIDVTATSTTEFEYSITTQPDSPATGNPEIVLGAMDIFQWVKSPVRPQDWEVYVETLNDPELPNGVPLNVDDPSYVQLIETNEFRQNQDVFFFWIRNSSGTNPDKKFTPLQIAERLALPTALNVPWFAPVDADNMLIFTDGEKVEDGYAFEVLIDRRNLETHVEWVLVSENILF
jgi:hypothetical protein